MPIIESTYQPPFLLKPGHLQTVYPTLFRRVVLPASDRERVELPDGDFIDLDWHHAGNDRVIIIVHGLEGSSETWYVKGLSRMFFRNGWDVAAVNLRGCSGVPNRLPRSYHSGVSDDLRYVINKIICQHRFEMVSLVGFSLGGNVVLKYLGEEGSGIHPTVCGAAAVSVPCDLGSASVQISAPQNQLYEQRFIRRLRLKILRKASRFPDQIPSDAIRRVKTLQDFDELYTAPMHGFESASDYYSRCSSRPLIPDIRIPTLLLSAQNDPLLSQECYPYAEGEQSIHFYLETPSSGGHVGFMNGISRSQYWGEQRIFEFISGHSEE